MSIINENIEPHDKLQEIKFRLIDEFRIRKFKSVLINSFKKSVKHIENAPEAFSKFILIFDQLYNKHFPIVTKTITRKSIQKPWVTDALVRKIKIKNNLLKLTNKGIVKREIYTRFKNILTTLLRQAKSNYFDNEFEKCGGNVKKTWNIINNNIKNVPKQQYYYTGRQPVAQIIRIT